VPAIVQPCRSGRFESVTLHEATARAGTRGTCNYETGAVLAVFAASNVGLLLAGQRGVAGAAAGCWVLGGAAGGAAAGRATAGRVSGSQRPFTIRIFRALHLRTAARTLAFDTQMPSTSWRLRPHPWRTGMTELFDC
jgi:hypothetical protein